MREANVASTLRIVQVCCSNVGFGAAVMVDAGDVVSHDAISRRGNNHPARQRRMYIQILYFRANRASMTRLVGAMRTSTVEAETGGRFDRTAMSADDRSLQCDHLLR